MRLIFPDMFCTPDPTWPLFFLAGPVQGGDDWQVKFCLKIQQKFFKTFYAAIPYVPNESYRLDQYRAESDEKVKNRFKRLIPWERHYMSHAARTGCLVFFLASESKTRPRTIGSYAQDTRPELGRWESNAKHEPNIRLVIGAERNFPGLPAIQENLDEALGFKYANMLFPIHETMDQTVEAACEMMAKRTH